VDEYLTEKEQVELIRRWWSENGWYLVGGAVIAGLGYFGYQQYQRYRTERAVEAAAIYQDLVSMIGDDRDDYDALLERLENDYASTPYADEARLAVARDVLISNPGRAAAELRAVMNQKRDRELAMVARLRLARVLAYQQDYAGALEVLDVEEPGAFQARLEDIRGDVHAAQGDIEAARTDYTNALTAVGAEAIDRSYVQMKLGDLPPAVPAQDGGA
jgi:predicted negative regulator of RcsB-dependent stress response